MKKGGGRVGRRTFLSVLGTDTKLDAQFLSSARKNMIRADVHGVSGEQLSKLFGALRTGGKLLSEVSLNARTAITLYGATSEGGKPIKRTRPTTAGTPDVHETKHSVALMNALAPIIATSQRLRVVSLSGIPFTTKSWTKLNRALPKSQITTLTISDCGLTDDLAQGLLQATDGVATLKSLDLSHNELTDKSINSLTRWIGRHAERRDMDCFNLALHTSETLEDQQMKVTGPTRINISHNKLGDEGVRDLAEYLIRDVYIRELDVGGHNHVSTAAARALMDCLGDNRALTGINMSGCPVYDETAMKSIERRLARNRRIFKKNEKALAKRVAKAAELDAPQPPKPTTAPGRPPKAPRRPATAKPRPKSVKRIRKRPSSATVKPSAGHMTSPERPPTRRAPPPDAMSELVRQKVLVGTLQMQVLELAAERNSLANEVGQTPIKPTLIQPTGEADRLMATPEGRAAVHDLESAVQRVRTMMSAPNTRDNSMLMSDSEPEPALPVAAHTPGMLTSGRPPDSPLSLKIRRRRHAREVDGGLKEGGSLGLSDVEPWEGLSDGQSTDVGSDVDVDKPRSDDARGLKDFYASLLSSGDVRSMVNEVNRLAGK